MMTFALIADIAPEIAGGWFSYLIQGGSFAALLIGGYLFAKMTVQREERSEKRLDALALQHERALEKLGNAHEASIKLVSENATRQLEIMARDSAANRATFESEMRRCRDDKGREDDQ